MVDNHPSELAPVVDEAGLLTLTYGDRAVLRQLIQLFLEDAPGQLADVQAAVVRRDRSLLEQQAHALRGAAAGMTGARVATVAARLEAAGRTGDFTGAKDDYGILTAEVERLRQALLQMAEERGG
jgi:HPt (histidine-containing phosphotransfer) domain-containing protein